MNESNHPLLGEFWKRLTFVFFKMKIISELFCKILSLYFLLYRIGFIVSPNDLLCY